MKQYVITRKDLITNNYDTGIDCDVPTESSSEITGTAVLMPETLLALILDDLIKVGAAE